MLCYVILCYVILCHIVLQSVMLCYVMLFIIAAYAVDLDVLARPEARGAPLQQPEKRSDRLLGLGELLLYGYIRLCNVM